MNKHVNKLNKEANDARKMIEDSDSDNSDDSETEIKVVRSVKRSFFCFPSSQLRDLRRCYW